MRFDKIIDTYNNIAYFLLQDEEIKKLLYYDSSDALSLRVPSLTIAEWFDKEYISNYLPVDVDTKNIDTNTQIILILDRINFSDLDSICYCNIIVLTDREHVQLSDHKNRLLEIINRIATKLDKHKFQSSGEVEVSGISHCSIGKHRIGYDIRIRFTSQSSRKVEI